MIDRITVFHEGERSLHKKLDIEERQHQLGLRMIRDHMPDQHRTFFVTLETVHIGVVDTDGHPWAVMRTGTAEFMTSPNDKTLTITSRPLAGEPANLNFNVGTQTSVARIEFETQRRNRLNTTVDAATDGALSFHVGQSYGDIVTDNRVGLQFVDFATGTLLNIKGTAELVEDLNNGELPLMGRGLRITVQTITRAEGALPIRYTFAAYSNRNSHIAP